MAYISLADDLKPYLGLASTNTNDDTLLTALIARATKIIESYTNRDFEVASDTTRYFTPGRDTCNGTLYFDEDLAQAPTTVTNGDSVVVTSAQYALLDRNRTPYRAIKLLGTTGLYWTYTNNPEDAITVLGRWGWSVTPPDDVKHAALRLTAWLYKAKDAQTFEGTAFSELGVIRIKHQLPGDVLEILDFYRRRS